MEDIKKQQRINNLAWGIVEWLHLTSTAVRRFGDLEGELEAILNYWYRVGKGDKVTAIKQKVDEAKEKINRMNMTAERRIREDLIQRGE